MQNDFELRRKAGESIRQWAEVLATKLSEDDAWRLMLTGALGVMLKVLGTPQTIETLRELADKIEAGEPHTLN
tara:strand:- start:1580 stop:1798 length:219 start_codon:yes stop_codon:yes gene_type:complete